MRRPLALQAALAVMCATAASVAAAAPAPADEDRAAALPAHIAAPYVEAWTGDSPAALAAESGNRYLTLAFLQTPAAGSCTADWNGSTAQPVSPAVFGSDIAAIQARGGNVIPSFGGYGADTTGTDIADSCPDVHAIAQVYESLVTTYHVPRIDLDVEADSLSNTAGIDRRNKAIAEVEAWAAHTGHRVQFSYTLPVSTNGLQANALAVLTDAKADGARVDVVNVMTFDYWFGTTEEMAADTETSAAAVESQLAALHPHKAPHELWNTIGVTEMPGIDDYGPQETFTTADAVTVERWAREKGISTLSFWALQRDNGGCVGTKGAGNCSGVAQPTWYFSHTFERFTHH